VIRARACQDRVVLSVDDNFLIILTESKKHFQENVDIKVAIVIRLRARFCSGAPASIFLPIFMTGTIRDVTFHERGEFHVATSIDFNAIQFIT